MIDTICVINNFQHGKKRQVNFNKFHKEDACKQRKNVDKYAYKAGFEEIKENDFNLNIPRYVDTFEEEEEINTKAVQKEIEGLESELTKVRKQMDKYLKELGL